MSLSGGVWRSRVATPAAAAPQADETEKGVALVNSLHATMFGEDATTGTSPPLAAPACSAPSVAACAACTTVPKRVPRLPRAGEGRSDVELKAAWLGLLHPSTAVRHLCADAPSQNTHTRACAHSAALWAAAQTRDPRRRVQV